MTGVKRFLPHEIADNHNDGEHYVLATDYDNLVAKMAAWDHRYDGGLTFGEIAAINGQGPCERCVGRSLESPPSDRIKRHDLRASRRGQGHA